MSSRLKRIWFLLGTVLPLLLRTRRRPVLFVRPGALGDVLCTFPAALELKKRHPGAACIYSCSADFACLPPMASVANRVTSASFAPGSCWAFLFTAIYHFSYGTERTEAATGTFIEEFCRQHDVITDDAHPRLTIPAAVRSRVKAILERSGVGSGPLILLHPGPSWPIKEWPAEAWAALVQELRRNRFTQIIQLGVGKHGQLGALPRIIIPDVFPLVDELTVAETVAMVSRADLLIGIDSGLMHIAASVATPAVGLFGPTSPQFLYASTSLASFVVSRVECQGCHHRVPRLHWMTGCPYAIQCMKAISVKDVLQVSIARLNSHPADSKK